MRDTKRRWRQHPCLAMLLAILMVIAMPAYPAKAAPVNDTTTSTGKRSYPYEFSSMALSTVARRYTSFPALFSGGSTPIPGLELTALSNGEFCGGMVPQGISVDGSYILITAYCSGHGACAHSHANHNPVVYVLDKNTHAFRCTIELAGIDAYGKGAKHVGGISYIPSNQGGVYMIATGNARSFAGNLMECFITGNFVEMCAEGVQYDGRPTPTYVCGNVGSWDGISFVECPNSSSMSSASFNTVWSPSSGQELWVGEFRESATGTLAGYRVSMSGDGGGTSLSLSYKCSYEIPKKSQGALFMDSGQGFRLLVSQSYGRGTASYLISLDATHPGSGRKRMVVDSTRMAELPPMLEGISERDGQVYSVFESGTYEYAIRNRKNRCKYPVDEVCISAAAIPTQALSNLFNRCWNNSYVISTIRCPVDVYVYDANDVLVASVIDGVVTKDPLDLTIDVQASGGEKTVYLPSDYDYRIDIVATDDGKMDVTVEEHDDADVVSTWDYPDVPLEEGSHHVLSLDYVDQETSIEDESSTETVLEKAMFTDVFTDSPHVRDIDWVAKNDISTGWKEEGGTRTFRPFNSTARADMAAFLFRMAKRWDIVGDDWTPTAEQKEAFSDVTEDTPHAKEIWWLASTGISTGWNEEDGSRTFRPYNQVVRQDMAAFLFRLAKLSGRGGTSDSWVATAESRTKFRDVSATAPDNHHDEVWWLAETGVSTGWNVGDGQYEFRGLQDVARCDMAAFLHRMDGLDTESAG